MNVLLKSFYHYSGMGAYFTENIFGWGVIQRRGRIRNWGLIDRCIIMVQKLIQKHNIQILV